MAENDEPKIMKKYTGLEPSLAYWIEFTAQIHERMDDVNYMPLCVAIASTNPRNVLRMHNENYGIWKYTIDVMEAHILCIEYPEISYHLMLALARGLMIVHPKWLAAINRNRVVTYMPENYFQSNDFIANWNVNIQQTWRCAQNQKIFDGDIFIMAPHFTLFYDKMKVLVKAAGGKVENITYNTNNVREKGKVYFVSDIPFKKSFEENYMAENLNCHLIRYHNIIFTILYYQKALMKCDTELLNKKYPDLLADIFGDTNYTSHSLVCAASDVSGDDDDEIY